MKSCLHLIGAGFDKKSQRFLKAGYPKLVLASLTEGLFRCMYTNVHSYEEAPRSKQKVALLPYIHKLSHNLKRAAKRSDVKVVLTAPNRLPKLYRMSDPDKMQKLDCAKIHRKAFVEYAEGVAYEIPLSCTKVYVGQTGRCLNDRLRKPANKVKKCA